MWLIISEFYIIIIKLITKYLNLNFTNILFFLHGGSKLINVIKIFIYVKID